MNTTDWLVHLLLSSPGPAWGPVIASVTVVDALVVLFAAGAAARGWQLGLTRLALGAAGLLTGALTGLWVANHLLPTGVPVSALLTIGLVLTAALAGAVIGAALGRRAAAVLATTGLRPLDRAAGALARGGVALTVCWLLAAGLVAFAPPAAASAASAVNQRSAVLRSVGDLAPALGRRISSEVSSVTGRGAAASPPSGGLTWTSPPTQR